MKGLMKVYLKGFSRRFILAMIVGAVLYLLPALLYDKVSWGFLLLTLIPLHIWVGIVITIRILGTLHKPPREEGSRPLEVGDAIFLPLLLIVLVDIILFRLPAICIILMPCFLMIVIFTPGIIVYKLRKKK